MSKILGTQYSIGAMTRRCAHTGRELRTGEPFVAALVKPPVDPTAGLGDEYVRLDFEAPAWDQGARPGRGHVLLGTWRGVVPEPGAKKRVFIDDTALLEMFEQSDESTDEQAVGEDRAAFRFVLALLLIRKRLLVVEGSKGRSMLVRVRGTPKPPEGPALIEVEDPGLDEARAAAVAASLASVLSEGDA